MCWMCSPAWLPSGACALRASPPTARWRSSSLSPASARRCSAPYWRRAWSRSWAAIPSVTGTQWFLANLLGACILYPFGLTVSLHQFVKLKLKRRLLEAFGFFAVLALTSVLAFRYGYPAMFLVLVLCIATAARFRLLGAGAALLVVSTLAFATVRTMPQAHTVAWVEILQFYLATISVVSVRTAMLLNERDLHIAIIERRHRRAVRASRFKSQLLAHVSHEVRSPLSAIIGFSAMLESGSLSAERAPEFAAIIAHNGELLQRLHDDLLDLSRAEAGALSIQCERVAVGSTLQTCIKAIRLDATLGGKDVLVERVEDALAVQADPVRLAQILNNLIANAYKYGDNFSPIRVRASRLTTASAASRSSMPGPASRRASAAGRVPTLPPVGNGWPAGARRRSWPFHRQIAGGSPGRADRFRERTRPPDPVLDRLAPGGLKAA